MEKFKVKKIFEISYAHRLYKYNGKCENLHGHNGKIEILIESEVLDEQNMVMDFNEIKKIVSNWLNENLDHTTFLYKGDPLTEVLIKYNQKVLLFDENPTAEIIAKFILTSLEKIGIKNIKSVTFWETSSSLAQYTKGEQI
ncbi:MAG: 6-carboxytetrahydropterin synthase [Elusimicrobiales bacterium]|nr:6-carboxytetrahydropterin synthase [Elusimicrobiales bacterium]